MRGALAFQPSKVVSLCLAALTKVGKLRRSKLEFASIERCAFFPQPFVLLLHTHSKRTAHFQHASATCKVHAPEAEHQHMRISFCPGEYQNLKRDLHILLCRSVSTKASSRSYALSLILQTLSISLDAVLEAAAQDYPTSQLLNGCIDGYSTTRSMPYTPSHTSTPKFFRSL